MSLTFYKYRKGLSLFATAIVALTGFVIVESVKSAEFFTNDFGAFILAAVLIVFLAKSAVTLTVAFAGTVTLSARRLPLGAVVTA